MISGLNTYTDINSDDSVVLYPSFGHLDQSSKRWRIQVCGTVYGQDIVRLRRKILVRFLTRVAKSEAGELTNGILEKRIRAFVTTTESGKRVAVRVGSHVKPLAKKTKRNGFFHGDFVLSDNEVQQLESLGKLSSQWLELDVVTPDGNERRFGGRVRLIPDHGISVISDIDDTMKHTEVTCKRTCLANTFLRDFRAVPGIADVYREWSRQGAEFHYVSSSPWQLYTPLAELCESDGFPEGPFHLRPFRWRDQLFGKVPLVQRPGKGAVIRSILQTFPDRRFLLVGDSGQRDPEIYGSVTRQSPRQVMAILIRELPQRPLSAARCRKAFRRLPAGLWRTFRAASDLPQQLPLELV
jgi:phosphatidate phosphatase APP1